MAHTQIPGRGVPRPWATVTADHQSVSQIEAELADRRKKLQKLNRDLARHAADKKSGSAARFDRIAGLRQEIEAVERKLGELAVNMKAAEEAAADPEDIQRTLERFEPVWESLTTREREKLIRTLVTKVGYDGRTGKVTRARVTQIMNLLNLSPDIQAQLLHLGDAGGKGVEISERDLRCVTSMASWNDQRARWRNRLLA